MNPYKRIGICYVCKYATIDLTEVDKECINCKRGRIQALKIDIRNRNLALIKNNELQNEHIVKVIATDNRNEEIENRNG